MTGPRTAEATTLAAGPLRLEVAAVSDIGPVRAENQDAFALHALPTGRVALLLADGMGGHEDGGVAARLAVTATAERLVAAADPDAELAEAVRAGNGAVARHRSSRHGMMAGTTLVAVVVGEGRASVANVGDSRCYLRREGAMRPLTEDHSWVAERVRAGELDAGAARHDPRRNILTRALSGVAVDVDVTTAELRPGDLLVLCSDGAWEPLEDDRLGALAGAPGSLEDAVNEACEAALAAGATDNVTIVACRVPPRG